jgi:hypothetical protein
MSPEITVILGAQAVTLAEGESIRGEESEPRLRQPAGSKTMARMKRKTRRSGRPESVLMSGDIRCESVRIGKAQTAPGHEVVAGEGDHSSRRSAWGVGRP